MLTLIIKNYSFLSFVFLSLCCVCYIKLLLTYNSLKYKFYVKYKVFIIITFLTTITISTLKV